MKTILSQRLCTPNWSLIAQPLASRGSVQTKGIGAVLVCGCKHNSGRIATFDSYATVRHIERAPIWRNANPIGLRNGVVDNDCCTCRRAKPPGRRLKNGLVCVSHCPAKPFNVVSKKLGDTNARRQRYSSKLYD